MEQTMNRNRIAILNEQFRSETEQGINAALAQGVNPWNEYLAALDELTQPAELTIEFIAA
jgi:hypothetical protein